jgi:hypothetical protein
MNQSRVEALREAFGLFRSARRSRRSIRWSIAEACRTYFRLTTRFIAITTDDGRTYMVRKQYLRELGNKIKLLRRQVRKEGNGFYILRPGPLECTERLGGSLELRRLCHLHHEGSSVPQPRGPFTPWLLPNHADVVDPDPVHVSAGGWRKVEKKTAERPKVVSGEGCPRSEI